MNMPLCKALVVLLSFISLVYASSVEIEVKGLREENIKIRSENAEIRAENADLRRDVTSLKERLAVLDGVVSKLLPFQQRNDTSDLEARVEALEEDSAEVETRVTRVEDDVDSQDERINLLQSQSTLLQTQVLANNGDIQALEDMMSQQSEEVTSLESRVDQLEENGGANVTALENQVKALEGVTSQLNSDVTSLDTRVDDLETSSGDDFQDTIFFAALRESTSSATTVTIFNRDVINYGGNYNPITGYYTAPYDGIYQFHVQNTAYTSDTTYIFIIVDGDFRTHFDYWFDGRYRSATVLLELQVGQTVHVSFGDGAVGDPGDFTSYFWGYMISAL